jgi:hypothetical protein
MEFAEAPKDFFEMLGIESKFDPVSRNFQSALLIRAINTKKLRMPPERLTLASLRFLFAPSNRGT